MNCAGLSASWGHRRRRRRRRCRRLRRLQPHGSDRRHRRLSNARRAGGKFIGDFVTPTHSADRLVGTVAEAWALDRAAARQQVWSLWDRRRETPIQNCLATGGRRRPRHLRRRRRSIEWRRAAEATPRGNASRDRFSIASISKRRTPSASTGRNRPGTNSALAPLDLGLPARHGTFNPGIPSPPWDQNHWKT